MKNINKPIVEKPIEIIQEVENSWEQEIKTQEENIIEEEVRTDEEGFYVAEVISAEQVVENEISESNLVHQPSSASASQVILDPKTGKLGFLFGIELEQCYLTYDSFWTTFLWRDGKEGIKKVIFEKVEEAQDLLESLENGTVRLVDDLWGLESGTNTKTKNRLKKELRRVIAEHENGKVVTDCFLYDNEWYA